MKKIVICLVVCFSIFSAILGTVAITKENKSNAVQTSSSMNVAYSATADTKEVQRRLKKWGYYTGAVDGINGPLTKSAVKKFQKRYGLVPDGIVGPLTAAKMGITLSNSSSSSNYNSNDRYLLAKVIYAEARGESYTGQVAIGAVVLNRVRDSRFPNTVAGVIYQPWAFTAVNDGQINLEPNQKAYQAADDALNGWDPTYGCVYYYNPQTATSKWIFTTKKVTQIGKHVFAV
ncbi:MAG: spore cortex-lytic enzyme [Clostridiales bacterium]|nr:spore cortex-lytic enzyme [Clostridiales bacterium]